MPASTITVAQWVRRTIQWWRRTDSGEEVDTLMDAPVVLTLWGPGVARKGWSPLPGFTSRSPLERSDEFRSDPAAVIEPRLRLDPVLADPTDIHPARVECDVVRDHLIARIRRAVAPGGVLCPPTPGRHGPVTPRPSIRRTTCARWVRDSRLRCRRAGCSTRAGSRSRTHAAQRWYPRSSGRRVRYARATVPARPAGDEGSPTPTPAPVRGPRCGPAADEGARASGRAPWHGDPRGSARSWSDPRHFQAHAIHARSRGEVQRTAVVVAPRHVRRFLGRLDGAEVPARRRHDPDAPGSRGVDVPPLIYLQAIPRLLARIGSRVYEHGPVRQTAVRPHLVAHDHLLLHVPVVHIQVFFVGGEREPIRPEQVGAHDLQAAVLEQEDTAELQLLARIVVELRQPERRIGEIECAVRPVDEVVGAVQPLPFILLGQHGQHAVLFEPRNPPVAVLVDREPPVSIQGEPVRPGLVVLADVSACVPALGPEHGDLAVGGPAVDRVRVGIAEEQVAPVADPNRPFGELEAASDLLDLRVPGHDVVECGIEPHDLVHDGLHPARLVRLVERQRRRTNPHVVGGWVGERPVDREHRELEPLPWFHVVSEYDAVRRVPSLDQLTPCLA